MADPEAIITHERTMLFDGKLPIVRVRISHDGVGGRVEQTREILLRQDAAAALVHDVERDVVILGRQVRAPVVEHGRARLEEIIAGKMEPGETAAACVRREIKEEVGYHVDDLRQLALVYASPGYSTERIHIFYAQVRPQDLVAPDAHGVDAGEDVERVEIPVPDFLARIDMGQIHDAKTLIAAQWLQATLALRASQGSR